MAKYHKPDVKRVIYECFKMFSNMYFKDWITSSDMQQYIFQELGVMVDKSSIAGIINFEMVGITKTKIAYTQYPELLGSSFIKKTLGYNPKISLFQMNGVSIKNE